MSSKILVIDDEESIRFTFDTFLSEKGYDVTTADSYRSAVSDIILKGKSGIDVLEKAREKLPCCPVVLITGVPEIDSASAAVRLGAFDYISKPILKDKLLCVVKKALEKKELLEKKEISRANIEAIFRSVEDAIITVDKDLTIIEINKAAERSCGFSVASIGNKFSSHFHCCNGRCFSAILETIQKKQMIEILSTACQHEGHLHQMVDITIYPLLNTKEGIRGAVLVIKDKTKNKSSKICLADNKQFQSFVGKTERMQKIFSLIEYLADVSTTVLITGESGTGKELVAEAIHYSGNRKEAPLIKVNCAALSESLLESELFGHVKGAFTGATQNNPGRFKKADKGTIFLDEIGDLSPKLQLKLLRVLQEKEFEMVGDSTPLKVDVRVIAATNCNLKAKIKKKEFREDLYYRLKVVEINMPPLRKRKEDLPFLVDHFIDKLNKKLNRGIEGLDEDVQSIFENYSWPGNIRELENILEHVFVVCRDKVITANHLPDNFKTKDLLLPTNKRLLEDEYRTIYAALKNSGGNKTLAAEMLGISRRTLYRKMYDYGIKPEGKEYSTEGGKNVVS